jgi:electron transport complex protein RnfB
MIAAILSLTVLGIMLGLGLGFAARWLRVESNPLAEEIESLMPGSQCGQCGFAGCGPAAAAIAAGEATVSICAPGGRTLAEQLAAKLGIDVDLSKIDDRGPMVAQIVHEELCTGCTRCFKNCPTDAIVGAPRQIHTVIRDACIGCGKCTEVCPTESLKLHPVAVTLRTWYWDKPREAA